MNPFSDRSHLVSSKSRLRLVLGRAAVAAALLAGGLAARGENLALRGGAAQSTVSNGGLPARAIDGNRDGNWSMNSVTHTAEPGGSNEYWIVDLGAARAVDSVTLWNRTDCCGGRMSNLRVGLLDAGSNEVYGADIPNVAPVGQGGERSYAMPYNSRGRYVRVRGLPGVNAEGNNIISIAECEVWGHNTLANLARHPQASVAQSSTVAVAARANDGSTDPNYNNGSVTQTDPAQTGAVWWLVDLGTVAQISEVWVFNRSDCCGGRLSNFRLSVFNGTTEVYGRDCFAGSGSVPLGAAWSNVFAAPLEGSSVRISLIGNTNNAGDNVLSLAEVQVFGTPGADLMPPRLAGVTGSSSNRVLVQYTEPVAAAGALDLGNYSVTGRGGLVTLLGAALNAEGTQVTLSTVPFAYGLSYTVTVNRVTDRAPAVNVIAPDSRLWFVASPVSDIGSPALPGAAVVLGGGFDLSGAGGEIGGTADQFTFVWEQRSGDFDVTARLEGFDAGDLWAKAGLMARESLDAGSRFAAVLATPGMGGAFFENRPVLGAAAAMTGAFPVPGSGAWVRLQRAGDALTGFISLDGRRWMSLGSVTLAMSAPYVGLAVSSHDTARLATARFRDYGAVSGGEFGTIQLPGEPLGPSSRRTPIAVSEIMYHPAPGPEGVGPLEYIEIYNSQAWVENIGGWRLSGSVDYTFPTNTPIQPGQFLVVARDPAALAQVYGIPGVFGPWEGGATNGLPNNNGMVRIRNRAGAVLLEVPYEGAAPWPVAADGAGHSLVLARPSYGEGNPAAWAASARKGGSPGAVEPLAADSLDGVVINEFLANSALPQEDFIELYNHTARAADLSGAWLSDLPGTNKFRIPDGVVLPAGGFVSFGETALGFGVKAGGDRIYLVNSNQTRVVDAVQFEAQSQGVSSGRSPDGSAAWYPLSGQTPGTNNSRQLYSPIVINEIMFESITGDADDEYVELYNRSAGPVDLGGWSFAAGITWVFPAGTVLGPDEYLVVARNAARLRANYPNLNTTNCLGNFNGTLANGGERLALARPESNVSLTSHGLQTNILSVVVNETAYGSGGRWGVWSAGGGSSLELRDARSDTRLAANWADSDESAKGVWTRIEFTGTLGDFQCSTNIGTNNYLQILPQGPGEYLVDDVEFHYESGANLVLNPSFETGVLSPQTVMTDNWSSEGLCDQSAFEAGGVTGSKCLRLRASARGDTGANRIRSGEWAATPSVGKVTIRAQARWLRGWPELLVRLHGGGAEAAGQLYVPANLGTPGARNSAAATNTGPAVYEVAHAPVLPAAGETVTVTARVSDPDGGPAPLLLFRMDPALSYTTLTMRDDGRGGDAVAGDGTYSVTLPGQAAGAMAAFYVQAVDARGMTNTFPRQVFPVAPLTRLFPDDSLTHECLARWGEPQMPGTLATYHLWQTSANSNRWYVRDNLNNAELDATFVYNNSRVVYNAGALFSGSPFHRGNMTTGPSGNNRCDYIVHIPEDDALLGESDLNLCLPGNAGGNTTSDPSAMGEQLSFAVFGEMGVPSLYRRFVHMFFNGIQRSTLGNYPGSFIFEDCQQPNGSVIREWYPESAAGELVKVEDWFEFNGNGTGFLNNDGDFQRREINVNGSNVVNLARYRFMWRKRSLSPGDSANDFTNFMALINVISPTTSDSAPIDYARFNSIINTDEWMREFVVQHLSGNFDSYGYSRGKNNYIYTPDGGRCEFLPWDVDWTMGQQGGRAYNDDLFGGVSDPRATVMYKTPEIRRAYLRAFKEAINGPFRSAYLDVQADLRAAALTANNVNFDTSKVQQSKTYTAQRAAFVASVLATNGADMPFTCAGPAYLETSGASVVISGTAPLEVDTLRVNGALYPVTWTAGSVWLTPTNWSVRVPVAAGSNTLRLEALNRLGEPLAGLTFTQTVLNTAAPASPAGVIVINEILANPLTPAAEYVELFNTSATTGFDLSGWEFRGLNYVFPQGSYLAARAFLVLARDPAAYYSAYSGAGPVFGQFDGNLQGGGETLALVRPGATPAEDLIVDQVRYELAAPWPAGAGGTPTAASLQLVDPSQDHTRPCNWATRYTPAVYGPGGYVPSVRTDGWRFVSVSATNRDPRLLIYFEDKGPADVYLDDLYLVPGSTPGAGTNLILNAGDFESGPVDTNVWRVATNFARTVVTNTLAHSGASSLHLVATWPGSAGNTNTVFFQLCSTNAKTFCTLSFWFYSTTSATNLTVRMPSGGTSVTTNVMPVVRPPYFAPPSILVQPVLALTPGASNNLAATLAPVPSLWLNEVQPDNATGPADSTGARGPWVELYNSGTNVVSLDGLYLTDTYASLAQWAFPAGAFLNPGQFRTVFCDGQPGRSTEAEWHAGFRLQAARGSVALVYMTGGQPAVLDYLNYSDLGPDRSYGAYPDGQLIHRRSFHFATPGAPNNPASPPVSVVINEWMAANELSLANPVGGKYEDWFELYNPTDAPQSLAGCYLTDTLTNRVQYKVPDGYSVPARGFLIVWADGKPSRNSTNHPDLHVNFQLDRAGEAVALFTGDGGLVDAVSFGAQTNDLSMGRFPDGAPAITYMPRYTPGQPNFIDQGNTPPVLAWLADLTNYAGRLVSVSVSATDREAPPQLIVYSLDPGAPEGAGIDAASGLFTWTPSAAQAPGVYSITVRATDTGAPALSAARQFLVIVRENTAPVLDPLPGRTAHLGQTLSFVVRATDAEAAFQTLTFSLLPGAPAGAVIDPVSGRFTWTPSEAAAAVPVGIQAADNGVPALAAEGTFTVRVLGSLALEPAVLDGGQLTLSWAAVEGMAYRVESQENLGSSEWGLVREVVAPGPVATCVVPADGARQFYRVTAVRAP